MTLRRAVSVEPAGSWSAPEPVRAATLAFDERHRRRILLKDDAGEPFLLDLAKAVVLGDGDGLRLENGGWLRVRAAAEDCAEIRCPTPRELARIAWHLGNRHLPVSVGEGVLLFRWDSVIVEMVQGLGAEVRRVSAPFTPEGGAYGGHQDHGHDHGPGHG
ncbi:urease accessory protein UreE [Arenibaculum pallidiluteum]|uniref:urease accessory protein UreE n=1 Tax=Arenibaculum pallidiluteum TaxID=2812559 RepID=UPI001A962B22|nr:urease accessory protein UreE [Arenibaculum pallidiluteum]